MILLVSLKFECNTIIKLNYMSRLSTQPDESFSHKLTIISSNMARINSQNKRLQQLLNHQAHLDRLREISDISAQNWQKLANLAENVQDLSVQAKTSRQRIHSSLNRHSQTLNKTLLTQIQNARSTLTGFQLRLNQLKSKEKRFLGNQLQKQRTITLSRLNQTLNDALLLLQKAQKTFEDQTAQKLKEVIQEAKEDLSQKYIQCRISLGHLHNLVAFYHTKKTDQYLLDLRAKQISEKTLGVVNDKLTGIQFNLRRIKGEVQWLKSRSRKNKTNIKQQRKNTQNYQPMEEMRNEQIGMSAEEVQYELKGLERILDFQSIIKMTQFQNLELERLNKIKNRLKVIQQQQQYYNNFYKLKP